MNNIYLYYLWVAHYAWAPDYLPGKPSGYNPGLHSINDGQLWGTVPCVFGLLGFPGRPSYNYQYHVEVYYSHAGDAIAILGLGQNLRAQLP